MFFDGGCKSQKGSGGVVLFDKLGECIGGRGLWFGAAANANNVAEAQELVEALGEPLVVLGDSELTINFMNRKCTSGK